MVCSACGKEMGSGSKFCSNCGRAVVGEPVIPVAATYPRLARPRDGRAIGGVCAGIAKAYGWDVIVVRLVLCAAVLFGCGTPVLAYLIAWIVMPNEPYFLPMQAAGSQAAA